MNETYQPGTLAPLVPVRSGLRKSKKRLWIGLGIGVILLCCIATVITVVIERNQILSLLNLPAVNIPFANNQRSLQTEDDTWQVKVVSVQTQAETIRDSNGNSASPKPGFVFLVVKTTLVNKSSDSQTLMIGLGAGDAELIDNKGNSYPLSAIQRGSSVNINSSSSLSMLYIYPNAPDGEPTDFIFAVPEGTVPASLKFKDLSPISPLPKL
jgi:hypothetical protein